MRRRSGAATGSRPFRLGGGPPLAAVTTSIIAVGAVAVLAVLALRSPAGDAGRAADGPTSSVEGGPGQVPDPQAGAAVPQPPPADSGDDGPLEPPLTPEPSPPPSTGSDLFAAPADLDGLLERSRRLTATIRCEVPGGTTTGSGWPVSPRVFGGPDVGGSLIITNGHVVDDCRGPVSVQIDGRSLVGEVIGVDYPSGDANDLAVVIIDERIETFEVSRDWAVGHWVIASGSPLSVGGMVTFGQISNDREGLIWTDAVINSGNSGGPLINRDGLVIGTNTWSLIDRDEDGGVISTGIGIAQPIERLCDRLFECVD